MQVSCALVIITTTRNDSCAVFSVDDVLLIKSRLSLAESIC